MKHREGKLWVGLIRPGELVSLGEPAAEKETLVSFILQCILSSNIGRYNRHPALQIVHRNESLWLCSTCNATERLREGRSNQKSQQQVQGQISDIPDTVSSTDSDLWVSFVCLPSMTMVNKGIKTY